MGYAVLRSEEVIVVKNIYNLTQELLKNMENMEGLNRYSKSDASYQILNHEFIRSLELLHAKANMILATNTPS
jgi:hypothetical protein